MNRLRLTSNGPVPEPLVVPSDDRELEIVNELGAEVTLLIHPPRFLRPSRGPNVTVPVSGWRGVVHDRGGDYVYFDPDESKAAPRNGRIDVS